MYPYLYCFILTISFLFLLSDEQDGGVNILGSSPSIMMHLPMPSLQVPNLDQADIVLAGFRDCTQEALRYLTDVEKIPTDDPIITGLKHHLIQQQECIDLNEVITCGSQPEAGCPQPMDSIHLEPHSLHIDTHTNLSPVISDTHISDESVGSDPSHTSLVSPRSQEQDEEGIAPSSSDDDMSQSLTSIDHSSSDEDMSQSVLSLALLAQNNPAIASLTEEILSLLEAEDAEDEDILEHTPVDCE